jgi:hypothetical protein
MKFISVCSALGSLNKRTYRKVIQVGIVGLPTYRCIEIIEVAFGLQVQDVKRLEKIESKGCAWSLPGCREPSLAENLMHPAVAGYMGLTFAERDVDSVLARSINHSKVTEKWRGGGTLATWRVIQLYDKAKVGQSYSLIVTIFQHLQQNIRNYIRRGPLALTRIRCKG